MTQSQVAAHLADKVGISKKQAKTTIDELTTLVVRELKKEGSLRLAGLGIFRKRQSKARMGRNPATGQEIKIPARTRLRFTAVVRTTFVAMRKTHCFMLAGSRRPGSPL